MNIYLLPERIFEKIYFCPITGHWIWTGWNTGKRHPEGDHGKVLWNKVHTTAHRAVYELLVGPIPDGHHLDHLCRYRPCVCPDHLEPVIPKENTYRGNGVYTMFRKSGL
jgi:hypothetical protein